jgi:TolA-binding protein
VRDLARLALADLARGAGRWDQAAEGYRTLIDDKDSSVPRDHALMRLAAGQEANNKPAEALASYRRLIDEFPSSVYVSEARRRADFLGARG